ncbi:hypothetical protein KFK09_011823 [Dendrobium nobile]|uniref:TRF2/HOY1 PH-like domain-containing protein n=1 Tax=Dendrobium nobile TaxID=94219 RepID=A0A8T3BJA6_DENNO|nr:hypothetical protein KFK09_011823 [Dendrobium nobile]
MVQLTNFGKLRPESKQLFTTMPAAPETVKAEIEDPLDEMYGPLDKRLKMAEPAEQLESKLVMPPRPLYDPLDEPSPLGLRLKKSPSFLDMIQMRLCQENSVSTSSATNSGLEIGKKKELKSTAVSGGLDKMKASNFPASILRIGNWEYVSRYEGDLVAKCYYAKHKLVWEVLDGGLKNKIEIQWSDITALKANCPENAPATLDIVCHQGLLNRHFEKLLQCDPRLKTLNQQPEIVLESSCFEASGLEDQDESKCLEFENVKDNQGSSTGFHDPKLPRAKTEYRDKVDAVLDLSVRQVHFHDSGASVKEPPVQLEQLKAPKLRASMSKEDLVSHLEQCISEQMASGNPLFSTGCLPNKEKLEELADHLLTDSQTSVSDEKSLISKVNSFYSLLQKDSSYQNLHSGINPTAEEEQYFLEDESKQLLPERKALDDPQSCGITRKESFGELLMNLPRIASFPQFLFCIAEDNYD